MSDYFVKDKYPFHKTQQCIDGGFIYKCCTSSCPAYILTQSDGGTVITGNHCSHTHHSPLMPNQAIKTADEMLFRSIDVAKEVVMKVTNEKGNSHFGYSNKIKNNSWYKYDGEIDEKETHAIREIATLHRQLLHQLDKLVLLQEQKSTEKSDSLHSSRATVKMLKHRVMLIGDTHVCRLQSMIVNLVHNKCIIEAKCKVGSELQDHSKKALAAASNYSEQDIVVFVGGADSLSCESIQQHFYNIRKLAEHTNVLQCEIPDANSTLELYSPAIREFNHYLHLSIILSRHTRLRWQKLKLEFDDFIHGTNNFNEDGKQHVASVIAKHLIEFTTQCDELDNLEF